MNGTRGELEGEPIAIAIRYRPRFHLRVFTMLIRYGFDIEFDLFQQTTVAAAMDVHPSRRGDVLQESSFTTNPSVPVETFIDSFGNLCRRVTGRSGSLAVRLEGVVRDSGLKDEVNWDAVAVPAADIPQDVLPFLMGSRYCETDILSDFAWANFGTIEGGWAKVQALCAQSIDEVQLSRRTANAHRSTGYGGTDRRVFYPSGDHALSLLEHSSTFL